MKYLLPLMLAASFGGAASATTISGIGSPVAAIPGGTVEGFDSTTAGLYSTLTFGNVTITGIGDPFTIGTDYNGSYNTSAAVPASTLALRPRASPTPLCSRPVVTMCSSTTSRRGLLPRFLSRHPCHYCWRVLALWSPSVANAGPEGSHRSFLKAAQTHGPPFALPYPRFFSQPTKAASGLRRAGRPDWCQTARQSASSA